MWLVELLLPRLSAVASPEAKDGTPQGHSQVTLISPQPRSPLTGEGSVSWHSLFSLFTLLFLEDLLQLRSLWV